MYYGSITGYVRSEDGQLEARTFWVEEDGSIQGTGGELLPIPDREPIELIGWAFNRAVEYAYDGEGTSVLIGQAISVTRKQLVKLGGKVWSKGDQRRIYFDDIGALLGETEDLDGAKLWMDANTGEFACKWMGQSEVDQCVAELELMASELGGPRLTR